MDSLCILKIQQLILIKSSCFPIGGSKSICLANIFRGRIEYELIFCLRGAKHRVGLLSSYSMRPRKIFALLYTELLKQKLQTTNYEIIKNKSIFLFPQTIAKVDKTT